MMGLKKWIAGLSTAAVLCASLTVAVSEREYAPVSPAVQTKQNMLVGEALYGASATLPTSAADADGDGIDDALEELLGTDAHNADSDGDGISDGMELLTLGSDPACDDSDRNGIPDGEEDSDSDGIINTDELALGTDLAQRDSDGDGIADGDETATDPLVRDTDDDGVGDGYELALGTDPVTPESTFSVTQTAETDESVASVDVTLDGRQVETLSLSAVDDPTLFPKEMPGYMGQAVELSVDGTFDEARLTFDCPLQSGVVEPVVYYFSETTQTLTPVECVVNDGKVTATVNESATYVLLDRTVYEGSLSWEDTWGVSSLYASAEVVLVMDDSASLLETDPDNRRLDIAQDLVANFPQNTRVGVVRFSTMIDVLTDGLSVPSQAASFFTTEHFRSDGGTEMYTAVETGLTLFESEGDNVQRVMIVLSDGDSLDWFHYDDIVADMLERDIVLRVIDLDDSLPWLSITPERFAQDAGGEYHHAENIDVLAAVCREIGKFIDLTVDTDGDTIPDYYEDHVIAFNGTHIALDKTKADTDVDGVPDNEEVSVSLVYSEDGEKVYVKGVLLSDPTLSDSDGDGMADNEDGAPLNNTYIANMTTQYAQSLFNFNVDYRWFLEDNTVYQPKISQLSSVMSTMMYDQSRMGLRDEANTRTANIYSCADLLAFFGMENTTQYLLSEDYSDNHLSEIAVGYRNLSENGRRQTVLAVIIRGTNATIEEWSSNCDIGDLSTDTDGDDWVNVDNHKGFDITAIRILRFVEQYIDENGLDRDVLTYWVTGHSRGAAIADIVGANLEKAGSRAFTYAFATPNNTLASDAASYRTIFNIINTEDFVPRLPMTAWGYRCYGRSTSDTSIRDSYETEWEKFTGITDYNPSSSVDSAAATIGGILPVGSDPRVESYRYTCACHGDGTNSNITVRNGGMSESSREKAIAKIPQNALPYCAITRYDGGLISGWDFEVCQTPAYFMQLLAAFMGKEIDAYRFAIELNYAKRYESAKNALISVGVTGVEHAHYPESYCVLANHVTADDFA